MNLEKKRTQSYISIKPIKGFTFLDIKELLRYKQLLWSLAWRDIRVKYAQTFLGFSWTFLNPILNLLILSFVFGTLAKIDTQGTPHLLFTIAGLTGWTYFSTLLSEAGSSIVASQDMIKKIYFPRLVIPLSKAISGLIDLLVTILCMVIIMIFYGKFPGSNIVYFPIFLFLAILAGLTGGIWISALSVRFRDFRYITPFLVRIGLYATPVAYPASLVPENYKLLFYLNPMVGVVEGFRWSLLGSEPPDKLMLFSIVGLILLFLGSLIFFSRIEKIMADII